MPVEGFEGIIDVAVAVLRANLPAAIAAVNAEHSDDIELVVPIDNPGEPDDGYTLGADAGVPYPYVEVGVPDAVLHVREVGNVHADADGVFSLRVLCADPVSSARLYRTSMRYASAILRVLLQPNAFGRGVNVRENNSVRVAFRWGLERTPPQATEKPQIVGGALLVFYLEEIEDVVL